MYAALSNNCSKPAIFSPALRLAISGNVPQGAGLSSSASLEVATGQFFKTLNGLNITPAELARIGQRAENLFVGCNCGIMDQLISAQGKADRAADRLPRPHQQSRCHPSRRRRRDHQFQRSARSGRQRIQHAPPAMRRSGALFRRQGATRRGPFGLRRAPTPGLDPLTARRARHIITDSRRAIDLALALEASDLPRISELMAQSHASMRDDFEITHPAIDALVDIVKNVPGRRWRRQDDRRRIRRLCRRVDAQRARPQVRAAVAEKCPAASGLKAFDLRLPGLGRRRGVCG